MTTLSRRGLLASAGAVVAAASGCSTKSPYGSSGAKTGVYRAVGQYQSDFGSVFALMFLATLPVLAFYPALQRHFVKGLTGGATKG